MQSFTAKSKQAEFISFKNSAFPKNIAFLTLFYKKIRKGFTGKGFTGKGFTGKGFTGKGFTGKGFTDKGFTDKGFTW